MSSLPLLPRTLARATALALALCACTTAPAATPTPTVQPPTASPRMPTLPPAATVTPLPTATPAPTATDMPSPSSTPAVTVTLDISATATLPATATVAETPTAAAVDKAEFVADVTLPDGSEVTAGTQATKTWRVRNAGTTTWGPGYELVYVRGESFGASNAVPLGQTVAPGQTADLSIPMTMPETTGVRTGFWQLRSAGGTLFGVGAGGNEALYLQVMIIPAGATAGPRPTTAPGGPLRVTSATLRMEETNYAGPCPHTLVFIGVLEVQGAGTVRYQLEATSQTPGFTFTLPDPIEGAFPGPQTFGLSYSLEIRNSVAGSARLRVTAPNEIASEPVTFTLTCQP